VTRTEIVDTALHAPNDAICRVLTSSIRSAYPGRVVVLVDDLYSTIHRFAAKGHCRLEHADDFELDTSLSAYQGEASSDPNVAWWIIDWQDQTLELVMVQVTQGMHRTTISLMAGPSNNAIEEFVVVLERFASVVEGAVLVFQDGCWRHDEDLYEDIQSSTLDNLILPEGMAEQVRDDIQHWLNSKELYEEHNIPWKRGMILIGPPGNGKTHMIKALANHFRLSTLYVRGFKAEYSTDSQNISKVFAKARACAPAMLIMEDLDTLVDDGNRSHFLNELDGFARNTGILAIASANDPERLDPALVNRPSRFDRRYTFDLPGPEERARYLQFFTSSLSASLRLSDDEASDLSSDTDGFSYAYLKELVLSSMMSWISIGGGTSFADVVKQNAAPLAEQMRIDPFVSPPVGDEEEEGNDFAKMARRMRRGGFPFPKPR